MDQNLTKTIANYLQLLQQSNISFEHVYLFGSYAKNKQTAQSDIDLAFVFKQQDIDYFDLQVQMLTLACDIDTRIEPHPIAAEDFTLENPLACEILNTGQEIFQSL